MCHLIKMKNPDSQSWVAESGILSSSSHSLLRSQAEHLIQWRRSGQDCQGLRPEPGSSLESGSGRWVPHLSLCSTGLHSLSQKQSPSLLLTVCIYHIRKNDKQRASCTEITSASIRRFLGLIKKSLLKRLMIA